jgi:hypothetical protein
MRYEEALHRLYGCAISDFNIEHSLLDEAGRYLGEKSRIIIREESQ